MIWSVYYRLSTDCYYVISFVQDYWTTWTTHWDYLEEVSGAGSVQILYKPAVCVCVCAWQDICVCPETSALQVSGENRPPVAGVQVLAWDQSSAALQTGSICHPWYSYSLICYRIVMAPVMDTTRTSINQPKPRRVWRRRSVGPWTR